MAIIFTSAQSKRTKDTHFGVFCLKRLVIYAKRSNKFVVFTSAETFAALSTVVKWLTNQITKKLLWTNHIVCRFLPCTLMAFLRQHNKTNSLGYKINKPLLGSLGYRLIMFGREMPHLPSKLRFSAKCSFFGPFLILGHYQPISQPPDDPNKFCVSLTYHSRLSKDKKKRWTGKLNQKLYR